ATVYRPYYPRLMAYGRKFTSEMSVIEDCIQELFVQFWIARNRLDGVQSIRSYLFVSFRHSLLKALEKLTRPEQDLLHGEEAGFSIEASIEQVMINRECLYESKVNLEAALEKLTGRQKEAVFLMFYEGMRYEEIAQVLQISTKATYKLMARAIGELRTTYKQNAAFWTVTLPAFLTSLLCV
ncbi:MAG: sigma-70 family RNA polymerase sigma factor, partial [Bacteroidota bacterium]|nr:sigma-70 family RNA polymerase sigma factor [Bacteroidota bacterium]